MDFKMDVEDPIYSLRQNFVTYYYDYWGAGKKERDGSVFAQK